MGCSPAPSPALMTGTPAASDLSPRLRQTLERLLAGDAEKQVARRLGLRPATVHEYVTAVYRHFHVSGRAELMAHFLLFHRPAPLASPGRTLP